MKYIYRLILVVSILYLYISPTLSADWAYRFVVHDGNIFVITDERVDEELIDKKIGEVTIYSDKEGTYSGNFSNTFPKGTDYYSIHSTSPNQAIAVQAEEGVYIKAIYEGKYAGSNDFRLIIALIIAIIVGILLIGLRRFMNTRK